MLSQNSEELFTFLLTITVISILILTVNEFIFHPLLWYYKKDKTVT